ncbi:hypothetical protein F4805DRAFT_468279 [Annulohypoxylon moriforme]|nr:hypothetical protein F4805DRAFT_468279 [Annulohypoxylon moriforme]
MSLRFKAESFRKRFKSVRQRLSPSLNESYHDGIQSNETQPREIRPPRPPNQTRSSPPSGTQTNGHAGGHSNGRIPYFDPTELALSPRSTSSKYLDQETVGDQGLKRKVKVKEESLASSVAESTTIPTGESSDDGTESSAAYCNKPRTPPGNTTFRPNDTDSACSGCTNKNPTDEHKFKEWSDDHLELQRRVIENYNNGDKLWTKEGLLRIEDQIQGDGIFVRIPGYVGDGQSVQKEKDLSNSKITVQFHGYQELAFPPASKPDTTPYNTVSIKTIKYDHDDNQADSDYSLWRNCYTRIWIECPIAHLLYATFMRLPLPPIDKIVCFDLGPIAVRWNEPGYKTSRGIYRHLSALTILEVLRKRFDGPIRLFAQDPTYHPDCVRMLTEKGFEIVGTHGAAGLAEIDDRTLVFAPNPGFCPKEIVADIAQPAAMFWNTILTPEEADAETRSKKAESLNDVTLSSYYHLPLADPDSPRVRELIRNYDKHFFPENNLFGKVALYTRASPSKESAPPPVIDGASARVSVNAETQTETRP